MDAFAGCPKSPELIDRRDNPSYGYRAVHIIVFEDGVPVEIQVRTKLQDSWAQITEKLGDAWGRGLRYGLGPDDPDAPLDESAPVTRRDIMEIVADLADAISNLEAAEYRLAKAAAPLVEAKDKAQDLLGRLLTAVSDALGGAG
jgi:ppGpp synthetase/RelA/SpoT-type nucleotidyltranferase